MDNDYKYNYSKRKYEDFEKRLNEVNKDKVLEHFISRVNIH